MAQLELKQYILELQSQIKIFTHLKLCLATAIHNFKWVKIKCVSPQCVCSSLGNTYSLADLNNTLDLLS